MFELQDLYKELAIKYNLSVDQIEYIARSQFKWLMNNIQNGEFNTIKLIGIGKFTPIPIRKQRALNKEYESSIRYTDRNRDSERKEESTCKEDSQS